MNHREPKPKFSNGILYALIASGTLIVLGLFDFIARIV